MFCNDGAGVFSRWHEIPFGYEEHRIALGDLDGDGDLDVFLSSEGPDKVLFNDGDGNLTDSGQALGDGSFSKPAIGDIDGDGDLDVIAMQVWINNGSGYLTADEQRFEDGNPVLGDIDGDGDLDMLGAEVWLNDGNGAFVRTGQFVSGPLGDLDGDGDLDAVASGEIWMNDGSGYFVSSGQSLRAGDLGDLDGDGDLDLFVDFNTVWLNDGTGFFSQGYQSPFRYMCRASALGDLDQDGDLDVVVAQEEGLNKILVNDGNANFDEIDQAFDSQDSIDSTLGDLDGDGDLDLVMVERTPPLQGPYQGEAPWEFTLVEWRNNSVIAGCCEDSCGRIGRTRCNGDWLETCDIAQDGCARWTNTLDCSSADEICKGDGLLFVDTGQIFHGMYVPLGPLGDLDGDGDLDLVRQGSDSGSDFWLNDGSGYFIEHAHAWSCSVFKYGDVDGDGDLDFLCGSVIMLNDRSANFTEGQSLVFSGTAEFGDVDGDGDLDVIADPVWLNDGNASFVDSGQQIGSSMPTDLVLGDLDGDDDLDLLVALDGPAEVWLNDGGGCFTDSGHRLGDNDAGQLALGDLDGDGDLDVVAAIPDEASWSCSFEIWSNDGNGIFEQTGQPDVIVGGGFWPAYDLLALGDFNGDGHLDLAAVDSGSLWILFNDGSGNLVNSGFYLPCELGNIVTTGDLDQDGDLDIIVSERPLGIGGLNWRLGKVWLNEGAQGACAGVCGDGQATASEQCDQKDLKGMDCTDLGFTEGTLGCLGDCTFDTAGCN